MRNLVSFQFNASGYNRDHYKTRLIGTSDCNMFVPFYSLFAHELLAFEDTEDRVIEYSLPGSTQINSGVRQYAHMLDSLKGAQSPKRYNYKVRNVEHFVNMHRGMLYLDETVFLCLGIDKEYLMSTPIATISENPDITKFTLFIDNAFEDTEELKNIRKKVSNMYIDPLRNLGVDVVYTSRLQSWLFKNNYKEPRFRTVTQMMKHLKEEVPKNLLIR